MTFEAKGTLGFDAGRPLVTDALVARLRSPNSVHYLDLVSGRVLPEAQTARGQIDKELFSVLQQLDQRLGIDLSRLPIDQQLAIIERRGEMLADLNATWAKSIARQAKLDKDVAFRAHLKKLVAMERQVLASVCKLERVRMPAVVPAQILPPKTSAGGAMPATDPRAALDRAPMAPVSATRGPRRGGTGEV